MVSDGARARIRAFVHGIEDRSATQRIPCAYGVALFNPDFPRSWAHNFVRLEGDLSTVGVDALVAEAERLHSAAGHAHRRISTDDDAVGTRLRGGFEERGWSTDRLVTMVHRRAPESAADVGAVEEVGFDVVRPALEELWRAGPYADSEETVRQLVERSALTAAATDVRHFAIRVQGRVASTCDLYSDGRTAQVEDVSTLEEFRGRGYARATVLRAVEEARAAGCDLVFLVADAEDWPRQLYGRLGFDEVGRAYDFTRPPADPVDGR